MIINLTQHAVSIAGQTWEPTARPARVNEEVSLVAFLDTGRTRHHWDEVGSGMPLPHEVPVRTVRLGQPVDLPDPAPGVYYVVSRMVADAAPDRRDLLIPHGMVRDDAGRVIGAEGVAWAVPREIDWEADRPTLMRRPWSADETVPAGDTFEPA